MHSLIYLGILVLQATDSANYTVQVSTCQPHAANPLYHLQWHLQSISHAKHFQQDSYRDPAQQLLPAAGG